MFNLKRNKGTGSDSFILFGINEIYDNGQIPQKKKKSAYQSSEHH